MNVQKITKEVSAVVKAFCGNNKAEYGCILGSGLGGVAKSLNNSKVLSYADIPYLQKSAIPGHAGQLCFGEINGQHVVCMQGRPHWYEGVDASSFVALIAAIKACGATSIFITNATGGINANYQVGDVVLIKDHINMQGKSPLGGISPPAFIGMDQVYDVDCRKQIEAIAKEQNIKLQTGVYCGVLGPNFETPAEIAAYKKLGADLVAMSVIPEVIVARYFNCKVIGLSVVSNLAAGLCQQELSHEVTLAGVKHGCDSLNALLVNFFKSDKFKEVSNKQSEYS